MDIVPSSETGQALQAAIQKQLASHGWSSEDDTVMAEYCLVMLGNRKTADQISTELSDLIGAEFEPSFVTWLFSELSRHYPDPVAPTSAPNQSSARNSFPTGSNDSRRPDGDMRYNIPNDRNGPRRPSNGVFGSAMNGMKRDSREMDTRSDSNQRARYERQDGFDGIPAGPRSNHGPGGQVNGRSNDRWESNHRERGGRSLMDRMQGNGYANAFDPVQNTINAVTAQGGNPAQFAALQNHPQAAFLNPQVLAQAQAHAMAQAQAFAAMQGQQIAWHQGGGPGFNGQFNGYAGYPQQGGRGGPQRSHPYQRKEPYVAAPTPLPTKPVSEQICKHGIKCSKAACGFSHPSPVATAESGMVLSSEACEKQLECTDPDCAKSHVSLAQKTAPAASAARATTSAPGRPAAVDVAAIPGAGEKPCKFAGSCTRQGCVFVHPWDNRGGEAGAVPCHWAEKCTRADCHFSHPATRPVPFKAGGAFKKPASGYSATFNNPANPAITPWPTEAAGQRSDRMKRFADTGDGPVERIIPGVTTVEVEMDDEPTKKVDGMEV